MAKKLTNYEKLKIPGILVIRQYTYIYKDKSKSDKNTFFYRCQKSNFLITIEINRENIKKIESKTQNSKINYIQKKEHKCENNAKEYEEAIENCSTENQILMKAKTLSKIIL